MHPPRSVGQRRARNGFLLAVLVAGIVAGVRPVASQTTYNGAAVAQKALDLASRLTVLSVGLQPGFEDLEALAYLRYGRGARIAAAFVTNGESGSSDIGTQIPGSIAFQKRREAYEALRSLDGSEIFLNFPDFGSAEDSSTVREWWDQDSLRHALAGLIRTVRPDVVLLAPDLESRSGASPRWSVLRSDLLEAVRLAGSKARGAPAAWQVDRVLADDGDGKGLRFPVGEAHALSGLTYEKLSEPVRAHYGSLALQMPQWHAGRTTSYDNEPAPRAKRLKKPDDGLPLDVPASLGWIGSEIKKLAGSVLSKTQNGKSNATGLGSALGRIAAVMDSVDLAIGRSARLGNRERKILLHWKEGLEALRHSIFGVDVRYRFGDSVLLAKQATNFTIDTVTGIPDGGSSEVFFPQGGQRWIVNEEFKGRFPLAIGEPYRLVSPQVVEYDLPETYGGRMRPSYGTPFPFFVIHVGKTRQENFFKKLTDRHLFAPKLTVELITPIVRAVPGEYVAVRVTNHSHDRLRDELGVKDSLVRSPMHEIHLPGKELIVVDTLELTWNPAVEPGDYRIPLTLGGEEVAYFAARKFDAAIDSSARLAVVPSSVESPTLQALRRLGIYARVLRKGWTQADLAGTDVLVLDERAFTLQPDLVRDRAAIPQFAQAGGRVVVLAQDAQAWNASPVVRGLRLEESALYGASSPVALDSASRIAQQPNLITEDDWQEWLFARSPAHATLELAAARTIAKSGLDGNPLLVSMPVGSGQVIYVNLELSSQLLNIHPGAFRLLANLVSAR